MNWMPRRGFLKLLPLAGVLGIRWANPLKAFSVVSEGKAGPENLPRPIPKTGLSVAEAIRHRRTHRAFSGESLREQDLSQLLFAAQGITGKRGVKRAAPSAGARYPLDVWVLIGKDGVEAMAPGVLRYVPSGHRIEPMAARDKRRDLARAALQQMWVSQAPVSLVIVAEYDRICGKYGRRGIRYAMIEAGHVGQNIFLEAEALGLKAGIVGAFDDDAVIRVLDAPKNRAPLLIMPVGHGKSA